MKTLLTFKVLVTTIDTRDTFKQDNYSTAHGGMGDVGSARYEPALLPPCPIIRVLRNLALIGLQPCSVTSSALYP